MWHFLSFIIDVSVVATEANGAQPEPSATPIDLSSISVDRLAPDFFNLAVIVVFVILFLRTASPLLHSRYLKHLAGAYALIGLFYLSSALLVQCKLILFFSAQSQPSQQAEISNLFLQLNKVGELIKLIFSSLSSCFLLLTWYLLQHYPKEGISRKFYGGVVTAYCLVIPAVIGVAQIFVWRPLVVMNVTDSIFACIGVLMVGFGLCRLVWIQEKLPRPAADIGVFLVATAFLCWSLPQVLYVWHQKRLWFWVVLAVGKVIAGLAAVLVSVAVLEAKPQYQAPADT